MTREPLCPWCGNDDPDECDALHEVGTCPWDGTDAPITFERAEKESRPMQHDLPSYRAGAAKMREAAALALLNRRDAIEYGHAPYDTGRRMGLEDGARYVRALPLPDAPAEPSTPVVPKRDMIPADPNAVMGLAIGLAAAGDATMAARLMTEPAARIAALEAGVAALRAKQSDHNTALAVANGDGDAARRQVRAQNAQIAALREGLVAKDKALEPFAEIGSMVAYVGGWPDYHTHWTPLPPAPARPTKPDRLDRAERQGGGDADPR